MKRYSSLIHGHFDKHEYDHGDHDNEQQQPAVSTHVTLNIIRRLLGRRKSFFCHEGCVRCPDVYYRIDTLLTGLIGAGRTSLGGRWSAT